MTNDHKWIMRDILLTLGSKKELILDEITDTNGERGIDIPGDQIEHLLIMETGDVELYLTDGGSLKFTIKKEVIGDPGDKLKIQNDWRENER